MEDKYIHNNSKLKERRRELRKNATPEERTVWLHIKNKKLGFKFLRQHSIGLYIVDFYCPHKKLIIELDGSQHVESKEYDEKRTQYLEAQGYKVLRFWNNEIEQLLPRVLNKIQECLTPEL